MIPPLEGNLIPAAILLGLINHAYFHRFEPKNAGWPLLALAIQPLLLATLSSYSLPSLCTILTVSIVFYPTLCTSIIAYRVSPFHPLAHVPGPLLNKVTKLWGVQVLLTGNQHRVNKALHDRYGPFVRTGPNEISIIHVDAVKAVLGTGGFQKGPYYDVRTDPRLPSRSLLVLRGDAHANRRRIWNRGMNSESLKEYEGILVKRVTQLMERLEETARKGPLDISKWFKYFSFDFMGDMAFGGGFEMLRDGGDKAGLWEILEKGAKNIAAVCNVPWIFTTTLRVPAATRGTKKLRKFGGDCAVQRIQKGAETKDLWYHLMDEAGMEKTKPTFAEVAADGVFAIIAGSDTTATALGGMIWYMLSHPQVHKRAKEEVDRVFSDEESLFDVQKHGELKYLTACLNETLRLCPPLPSGGPRKVPPGGGKLIADCYVPEETDIYIPAYSLHRREEYFGRDPESFNPDRWLDASDGENATLNHAAFIPFSYGAANCVGKALAWREMFMVTSSLLKKFEVRFARGFEKENEVWPETLQDYLVTNVGGRLMVELEPRR